MKTHPESKCPELLANYCDMLLRKTPLSKKLTSEETEGKLRDVVSGEGGGGGGGREGSLCYAPGVSRAYIFTLGNHEDNKNCTYIHVPCTMCIFPLSVSAGGAQVCSEQGCVHALPQDSPHQEADPGDLGRQREGGEHGGVAEGEWGERGGGGGGGGGREGGGEMRMGREERGEGRGEVMGELLLVLLNRVPLLASFILLDLLSPLDIPHRMSVCLQSM